MRLFLDIGFCQRSTKRGTYPGSCIAAVTDTAQDTGHGILLACAEGIAERPDAENAAKSVTTALGDVYYAANGAGPEQILEEGMRAANQAVRATGERGRAAAVAALVLRGHHWYAGHAGHIRAWRYHDFQIKQLTRDHLLPLAPRRTEITKACGYDESIEADYDAGTLKEGDIFLLTTPGVHDALAGSAFLGVLQSDATAQQMAETLVNRALSAHTPAYAAVCLARVEKLPEGAARAPNGGLPLVKFPELGAALDDFVIEKLIFKGRRFRLYKAKDGESGESVMLRFPDPRDEKSAQNFLREEMVASRAESPYLLKPIMPRPGRRTARYSVFEYHRTENLAKRIKRKGALPLAEGLPLAEQLLGALEALHRHGVIHGDVRPHHVFYDRRHRQVYLLAMVAAVNEEQPTRALSYHAPERFADGGPSERGDIYAAGATIYYMLTGAPPYGKIRSSTDRSKLSYISARSLREDFSATLDDILARACAADPADRYPTVAPFAAALATVPLSSAPTTSPTPHVANNTTAQGKNAWWFVAVLAAALLAYLYFALR